MLPTLVSLIFEPSFINLFFNFEIEVINMQDVLKALIAKTELSMTEILGGTIASVVYAILILIAILIAYRISKKLIVGAI